MSKWIKYEKAWHAMSADLVLFNKILLYAGKTDHLGIGINIGIYDRSLTFEIFNLYTGISILHKGFDEWDQDLKLSGNQEEAS